MPETLEQQVIQLQYQTHPLVLPIHHSKARFRVVDCGRRFGKSLLGMREGYAMSKDIWEEERRTSRGVVVAPTVKMLMEDWWMAQELLKPRITNIYHADMWINTDIAHIDFKSSESQGGVGRGAGYDWAILDEAARIPRPAWEEDLRPALADRQGRAMFISTPVGRNWFYELFRKGREKEEGFESWQHSTIEGWRSRFAEEPEKLALAEREWEEILRTTSERTLRQEYLADFLEDVGQLWQLTRVLRGHLRPAIQGRTYIAGLDVAAAEDWMVTAIFEVESKQLVGLHRSKHRAWHIQEAEAMALIRQYPRCHTLIDSTGVGDPIAQKLRHEGLSVEDVIFTPRKKSELVEQLSVAIDHGYIGIPDQSDTQWLLDELRSYAEEKLPSGKIRYGAPPGLKDDGVTACMLAVWGLRFDLYRPIIQSKQEEGTTYAQLEELHRRQSAFRKAYGQDVSISVPMSKNSLDWHLKPKWRGHLTHAHT